MSSAKSIDGLRRREDKVDISTKTPKRRKVVARRKISEESPRYKLEKLEKKNRKINDKEVRAIHEYLESIHDENPTDLIETQKADKKKKKRNGKKNKKKIILIILGLFLLAGAALYIYFNDLIVRVTDGGNLLSVLTANPDTPLEEDENGRTNILVFGTEGYDMNNPNYDGGYLTDSMLMISINQDDNSVKAVSLPRDLKYGTCTGTGKLNEVFYCEYQKNNGNQDSIKLQEKAGATKLEEAFEKVLGVKIQYYTHLNWEALIKIVNSIGGIDVYFTYGDEQSYTGDDKTVTSIKTSDKRGLADGNGKKMYYKYKNGEVIHLDGAAALAVARTRNAYGGYGASGGNFSREYFQQKIIEAIVKKMKAKNLATDWGTILGIKEAVGDNLRTNFKDTELKTLMKLIGTINIAEMESIHLQGENESNLLTTGMIGGISYVYPVAGVGKYDNIHSYVKKKLSNNPIITENATIIILNGTKTYGVAAAEKDILVEKFYNVKSTGNAPSSLSDFDGVKIYQRATEKLKTAEALQQLYNDVELTTDIPGDLQKYDYNFIIILGNGYSYKSSN